MSAPNFSHLLNVPADQVERPKPLPAGTYHGIIEKYAFDESKEKKTPFLRVFLKVQAPGDDIDTAALEGIDLTSKSLRKDYYLTKDALWRLKEFIESLGISTAGRLMTELVPEIQNASVLMNITLRPSQDGKDFFNDVADVKGQQ